MTLNHRQCINKKNSVNMCYYKFIINGSRKPTLVSLCQAAVTTGTNVNYLTNPDLLLKQ